MGRRFVPTEDHRRQVERLSALGINHADIASVIRWSDGRRSGGPINAVTLREHFSEELEAGRIKAVANVAGVLYQKAMEGNIKAIESFLWRMGWRNDGDQPPGGVTVVNSVTVSPSSPLDLSMLSTDELRTLHRISVMVSDSRLRSSGDDDGR